jgi:hypothetical protein
VVYAGTRDLPKTHIVRMRLAGYATVRPGWPTRTPTRCWWSPRPWPASLASELVRLLPELRAVVGPDRQATVVFDRGGWSPATFAAIGAAWFDLLTYRKGPFNRLPDTSFTAHTGTDPTARSTATGWPRPPSSCPCRCRTGPGSTTPGSEPSRAEHSY